jgi:hypothetical protein
MVNTNMRQLSDIHEKQGTGVPIIAKDTQTTDTRLAKSKYPLIASLGPLSFIKYLLDQQKLGLVSLGVALNASKRVVPNNKRWCGSMKKLFAQKLQFLFRQGSRLTVDVLLGVKIGREWLSLGRSRALRRHFVPLNFPKHPR